MKGITPDQSVELKSHLLTVDAQKGDTLLYLGAHKMEQCFIFNGILKRLGTNQQPNEMMLRFADKRDMENSYAAWR